MKNLKQLCLFLSAGTIAALSIGACSDDTTTPGGTAGTSTTAGTTGTAGSGTAGTGTAGTGTAGTGTAGTATAGTSSGGTGTAGTASGGTAAGGASGGSGGKGGSGGSGGASGGSSGGGGAGGGASGGAPSADCTKWCSGAMSVVTKCAGHNLLNSAVDSEAKCISKCTGANAEGAMGLACWIKHTAFIVDDASKNPHCGHASGKPGAAGECHEIP